MYNRRGRAGSPFVGIVVALIAAVMLVNALIAAVVTLGIVLGVVGGIALAFPAVRTLLGRARKPLGARVGALMRIAQR